MASTRHLTLNADVPEHDLFSALLHVAQQTKRKDKPKYEIGGISNEIKEMGLVTAKTPMSWGHVLYASVVPQGQGSVLQLTVDVTPGTPTSLMDGRKNQKMAEALIAEVEAVLADPAKPQPAPVESFQILDDGTCAPWTTREFPA